MAEQRTDAELRAQFSYHGETLECTFIATQRSGNIRYYKFTIDRSILGEKDPLFVTGNDETIKMFLDVGIQYDTNSDYGVYEPKYPIPVVVIHDEKDNRPRIQAVMWAGRTVRLADVADVKIPSRWARNIGEAMFTYKGQRVPESEYRRLKALEQVEMGFPAKLPQGALFEAINEALKEQEGKENQEIVGTPYILPTGDSLPELLAQLDTICDKLNKIWQDDGVKIKTNAYGSNKMKRMIIGRIWQDIDGLIKMADIKDLRRKKVE